MGHIVFGADDVEPAVSLPDLSFPMRNAGNLVGSGDILKGNANGTGGIVDGIIIKGNDAPNGRNILQVEMVSGRLLEVRSAATVATATVHVNCNLSAHRTLTMSAGTGKISFQGGMDIVDMGAGAGVKLGDVTTAKFAFWGAAPVVQQVLATGAGASVDNVITLLQTLGLCKQA